MTKRNFWTKGIGVLLIMALIGWVGSYFYIVEGQVDFFRLALTFGIPVGFPYGDSVLTVTETNLKFNKATAVELNYPPYIRMLVNAEKKQVAIQTCKESSKNAVKFSKEKEKQKYAVVIKAPALQTAIRKLIAGEGTSSVSFHGELFPNENIIIYDLTKGEEPKRRGKRKKSESVAEEHSEAK